MFPDLSAGSQFPSAELHAGDRAQADAISK